jgi:hypothetical protein
MPTLGSSASVSVRDPGVCERERERERERDRERKRAREFLKQKNKKKRSVCCFLGAGFESLACVNEIFFLAPVCAALRGGCTWSKHCCSNSR